MADETQTTASSPGEDRPATFIGAWHDQEIDAGRRVPDVWDDCNTNAKLAAYLWKVGYRKI